MSPRQLEHQGGQNVEFRRFRVYFSSIIAHYDPVLTRHSSSSSLASPPNIQKCLSMPTRTAALSSHPSPPTAPSSTRPPPQSHIASHDHGKAREGHTAHHHSSIRANVPSAFGSFG
ncbi:hypothetical protein BDN67DRAFT_1015423 [Paxillus ammoniavirescens]|nr:hypothetical protein BDN67DRAFT_1015423 [Paxillus ammoniavirescens]